MVNIEGVKRTLFITGTDTGVGKTVVTALLARDLVRRGVCVAAFKPLCSGGRADARILRQALGGGLTLDEINPWHFRAPVAPLLAARREGKNVRLPEVTRHIQKTGKRFDLILVEGAGGLMSPLGEGFDSLDLLAALKAEPVIVAANKLGVVSHVCLTLAVLPAGLRRSAKLVLVSPAPGAVDAATRSNRKLLAEFLAPGRIFTLPWLGKEFDIAETGKRVAVSRDLIGLVK